MRLAEHERQIQIYKNQEPAINLKIDLLLPIYPYCLLGRDVWLRPLFPEDASFLLPIYTNDNMMKYFGSGKVFTEQECKNLINIKALRTKDFENNFPIQPFGDAIDSDAIFADRFVNKGFNLTFFNRAGLSGIVTIFHSNNKDYPKHLEVAYCGQGGTCDAVLRVLSSLNHFAFLATAHPNNHSSIKILKKNSFVLVSNDLKEGNNNRNYYIKSL